MSETHPVYIPCASNPESRMNLPNLIENMAAAHGLPFVLVHAIVQVESGGNPWAVRYEPAFFSRYVADRGHRVWPGCSRDTEERLRACSFGLMQLMGQTARERGFDGPFLSTLCDAFTGLDYGCRHLVWLGNRYKKKNDWTPAVAAYNAGSPRKGSDGKWVNQEYVDKIRAAGGFR
jgi:soluble lytic murein transglycosylase-like protein